MFMYKAEDSSQCLNGECFPQDDEGIPVNLRATPEYQELMRLKRLYKQKLKQQAKTGTEHIGFKV
mgnify:CR=1 FL=1